MGRRPSAQPSRRPSRRPSTQPWQQPSAQPSTLPSRFPTTNPTTQPLAVPTLRPSESPTALPSTQPLSEPSLAPSAQPAREPSVSPSHTPTSQPSHTPSGVPMTSPSLQPLGKPSCQPSVQPLFPPTACPSSQPADMPSRQPMELPSRQPSSVPSAQPVGRCPSVQPSPTLQPLGRPSQQPSAQPSTLLSRFPTTNPTTQPLSVPTVASSTILSFETSLTIFGVSEASFLSSSSAIKALKISAATPISGIIPAIALISVKDISSVSSLTALRFLSSAIHGCEVNYKVAFTISAAAASFSPSSVYTAYTTMISASVSSGNFTKSLQTNGGSIFDNATIPISSLNFSSYSIKVVTTENNVPSSRPTSHSTKIGTNHNDRTAVSALVIGLVSGSIALILGFCYAIYTIYFRATNGSCYHVVGHHFLRKKLTIVPICAPSPFGLSAAADSQFQDSPANKPAFLDLEHVRTPNNLRRRSIELPMNQAVQNLSHPSVHYDEPISPSLKIPELFSEGKEQYLLNSVSSFKRRRSSKYIEHASPTASSPKGFLSPNRQKGTTGSGSNKKGTESQSALEDVESIKYSPTKQTSKKF